MKQIIFILMFFLIYSIAIGQISTPTAQSNNELNFRDFLAGVKYAEVLTTPELEAYLVNNPNSEAVYGGVIEYLEAMNFKEVGFSSDFHYRQLPTLCDKALVLIEYEINGYYIEDFTITFFSCDNEWWQFKSSSSIVNNGWNSIESKVFNRLRKMNSFPRMPYNKDYRRILPSEETKWDESILKEHFLSNGTSSIEGIYESTSQDKIMGKYKIGIVEEDDEYKMLYIGGALNYEDWIEGEIKAELLGTASSTLFKLKWRMGDKSVSEVPYATFKSGMMNVVWPDFQNEIFIKIFPTQSDNINSSGTGFALSPEGYIVTNYHVIKESSKINVRGVKGDFSKSFLAETVIVDKNNDIAIIKIDDPNFITLGQPPYTFDDAPSDVGRSVFSLGYPLRESMGDEIKLTNGIISAKTGFQGDVTTYQISVPLHPGNSGGPLINNKGEIIGIIKSKHSGGRKRLLRN